MSAKFKKKKTNYLYFQVDPIGRKGSSNKDLHICKSTNFNVVIFMLSRQTCLWPTIPIHWNATLMSHSVTIIHPSNYVDLNSLVYHTVHSTLELTRLPEASGNEVQILCYRSSSLSFDQQFQFIGILMSHSTTTIHPSNYADLNSLTDHTVLSTLELTRFPEASNNEVQILCYRSNQLSLYGCSSFVACSSQCLNIKIDNITSRSLINFHEKIPWCYQTLKTKGALTPC
jgi:hypothetical protein